MKTTTINNCTLYLADYRDVLPLLGTITAVVADPPYGNDYRQKRSRDKLVRPDTTHAPIVGNAEPFDPAPLLTLAPTVVLWGANYYADKLPANGKWLVTGRVLKPFDLFKKGYMAATLKAQDRHYKCLVHRLVALRYLPPPPRYMEVDHINGDKLDNRIENLCWATRQENVRRDFECGRVNIGANGERHNNAVLTDREALAILRIAALEKLSPVEISECFDIAPSTVHALIRAKIRNDL